MIYTSIQTVLSVAVLLGISLAMDAFSISIVHGISDKYMSKKRMILIPLTFGIFQMAMPLIGWAIIFGISNIPGFHSVFSQIVPPLALVVLCFLGIKMIIDYKKSRVEEVEEKEEQVKRGKSFAVVVILEAIATSIDALSSGLAMSDYSIFDALISVSIIFAITFILCVIGVYLGGKLGAKIGDIGLLIGGIILITLGVILFVKGELKTNFPEYIPEWLSFFF